MASRALSHILHKSQPIRLVLTQRFTRCMTMESRTVPAKPESKSFGLAKVVLLSIPFMYVGAVMSREGAAWLEENDIFSPEDDD